MLSYDSSSLGSSVIHSKSSAWHSAIRTQIMQKRAFAHVTILPSFHSCFDGKCSLSVFILDLCIIVYRTKTRQNKTMSVDDLIPDEKGKCYVCMFYVFPGTKMWYFQLLLSRRRTYSLLRKCASILFPLRWFAGSDQLQVWSLAENHSDDCPDFRLCPV